MLLVDRMSGHRARTSEPSFERRERSRSPQPSAFISQVSSWLRRQSPQPHDDEDRPKERQRSQSDPYLPSYPVPPRIIIPHPSSGFYGSSRKLETIESATTPGDSATDSSRNSNLHSTIDKFPAPPTDIGPSSPTIVSPVPQRPIRLLPTPSDLTRLVKPDVEEWIARSRSASPQPPLRSVISESSLKRPTGARPMRKHSGSVSSQTAPSILDTSSSSRSSSRTRGRRMIVPPAPTLPPPSQPPKIPLPELPSRPSSRSHSRTPTPHMIVPLSPPPTTTTPLFSPPTSSDSSGSGRSIPFDVDHRGRVVRNQFMTRPLKIVKDSPQRGHHKKSESIA
ncbi:hypothetical protein C8J56DRAFT_933765 [Mycena floridula]|nr:hypothetical protein C8J56DRAFT_933765 [Mycena floridula]